jgi:hypothetical protein
MRTRTERRALQRAAAKETAAIHRELAARGLADRAAVVNRAVSPGAAFFWHALKARIAAREAITPLRGTEGLGVVRDIAMKLLSEEGVDTTGLVLKVEWHPPYMWLEAVADLAIAIEATEAVRARARPAAGR